MFHRTVVLWATAFGCTGSPETRATRSLVAGVEVVISDSVDRPSPWTVKERMRFGSMNGPTALHGIDERGIAMVGGRLFVLDRGNRRVAVANIVTGKLIASFGREGRGPMELWNPLTLWVARGTVFVLEGTREVALRFSVSGEPLGEYRVDLFRRGYWGAIRVGPGGLVFALDEPARREAPTNTLSLIQAASEDSTTLFTAQTRGYRWVDVQPCNARYLLKPLWSVHLAWFSAPWGTAVNGEASYTVELLGKIRRRVERRYPPHATTRNQALSVLAEHSVLAFSDGRRCRFDHKQVLKDRGYEPERQQLSAVALSPEGELWVRRRTPEGGGDSGPIDVFDVDGAYVGTFPPEKPFPVAFATSGAFATIETDHFGVEQVVVYDVTRR